MSNNNLLLRVAELRLYRFVEASRKRTGNFNEALHWVNFILQINKDLDAIMFKSAVRRIMERQVIIRPTIIEVVQLYRELQVPVRTAYKTLQMSPNKYYNLTRKVDPYAVIIPKLPLAEAQAVYAALETHDTLAHQLRQGVDFYET